MLSWLGKPETAQKELQDMAGEKDVLTTLLSLLAPELLLGKWQ